MCDCFTKVNELLNNEDREIRLRIITNPTTDTESCYKYRGRSRKEEA